LVDAYIWLFRTLVEGFSVFTVNSAGGVTIYYIVRLTGISLVAFVTGSISSRLVAAVVQKGKGMGSTRARGHIVICGWSGKGAEIIRELRAKEVHEQRAVVVLAPLENDPTKGLADFISGDPSDAEDLARAGINLADTAIILADESQAAGVSDSSRDARTLLTCLAVESLNPNCYTCVEVVRSENRSHFSRTKVDEMVVSAELTGALLASSAATHGLSGVVSDLLTHPQGEEFYRVTVPPELAGTSVREGLGWVKDHFDALLVGIAHNGGAFELNPPADRMIDREDQLLVVAHRMPALAVSA
jgi:voltage-gated potassium channel